MFLLGGIFFTLWYISLLCGIYLQARRPLQRFDVHTNVHENGSIYCRSANRLCIVQNRMQIKNSEG